MKKRGGGGLLKNVFIQKNFFRDGKYSVETLLAMILWNAKEQTEVYARQSIRHAIITIPAYFTQIERLAISNAAEMAGLKLLQV